MKIGIVITATNAYSVLGIRFMKRFMQHYKGKSEIKFYFFSDINPKDYIPNNIEFEYFHVENDIWHVGNNLRFDAVLSIKGKCDSEYLYYFDADTNIRREFTEDWFIGEMVGGQHFLDQLSMKDNKGYERNKKSQAYIPYNTNLPQIYLYGAFWGGLKENVFKFCDTIQKNRKIDKENGYKPAYNEKYINHYFHYNPPSKIVMCPDFVFRISDKGSLGETRRMDLNVTQLKNDLKKYKNNNIDIISAKVVLDS